MPAGIQSGRPFVPELLNVHKKGRPGQSRCATLSAPSRPLTQTHCVARGKLYATSQHLCKPQSTRNYEEFSGGRRNSTQVRNLRRKKTGKICAGEGETG